MACGLRVARTILPDGDVSIPVRVINTKSSSVVLKSGAVISNLEPVDMLSSPDDQGQGKDVDDLILCEMVNRVDASVSMADRMKLKALLEKYSYFQG